MSEKLLHQLLSGLGQLLVEKKVPSELEGWGADRIYFAIREQLKIESGKSGPPDILTRAELSAFLIREGIMTGIMKPIRTTARAQRLPLVAIAIIFLIVPPLCLRLARTRFGRPAESDVTPPPATPTCP